MRTVLSLLSLLFVSYTGMVSAAVSPENIFSPATVENPFNGSYLPLADHERPLFLAGADNGDTDDKGKDTPAPGTLVIPGEENDKSEKKCLNICRKWGEECIINPRTGARNCRRTCKDFGMECF